MKNRFSYIVAFFLMSVFSSAVSSGACRGDIGDSGRDTNPRPSNLCSGTIEVAIWFVDENDEPLRGVTVISTSTKHDDWGFTTENERENITVDGVFSIEKTGICNLRLQIGKSGFYGERIDYSVKQGPYEINDISDIGRIVVLKPMPTPAPMKRIEGVLKTSSTGPLTAVRLEPGVRDASRVDSKKEGNVHGLGACCFLSLPSYNMGVESVPWKSQGGRVFREPVGASLRLTQPEDGFFIFWPQYEGLVAEKAFREMRVAPEDGYVPELEFPPDAGDRVYFYCRIGGMYGKGIAVRPYLQEEDGEITAVSVVKILVNPTGDRNVTTLD